MPEIKENGDQKYQRQLIIIQPVSLKFYFMKIFILFSALFVFVSTATAQKNGSVSGSVLKSDKAADGATVTLLRARDSATVKLFAANKEGMYVFENVPEGEYLVSATTIGHQKGFSKNFSINDRLFNKWRDEKSFSMVVSENFEKKGGVTSRKSNGWVNLR